MEKDFLEFKAEFSAGGYKLTQILIQMNLLFSLRTGRL